MTLNVEPGTLNRACAFNLFNDTSFISLRPGGHWSLCEERLSLPGRYQTPNHLPSKKQKQIKNCLSCISKSFGLKALNVKARGNARVGDHLNPFGLQGQNQRCIRRPSETVPRI